MPGFLPFQLQYYLIFATAISGGGFAPDSHGWLGRYISDGQLLSKGEGVGVRGGRRAFL